MATSAPELAGQAEFSATLVRVARLHYEHGMTHQEIADALGFSRIKVTRMLSEARRAGVVEITVHGTERPFREIEDALRRRFGLVQAWVAPSSPNASRAQTSADLVGAECIAEHLSSAHTVAMGISATVAGAVDLVSPGTLGDVRLVPLAGGWGGIARGLNPDELAVRLAGRLGARAYNLPSPLVAGNAEVADSLRRMPAVAESLSIACRADTLIVGIGALDWTASLLRDSVTPEETRELGALGAVGDVSARFFDRHGHAVASSFDGRVIGLTLEEMRRADTRIALAHGRDKLVALRAALAGGLVTVLVTDTDTAKDLLSS